GRVQHPQPGLVGTIVRAIRPFFAPVSLSQGPRHKRVLPWHPFLPPAFTRALVRCFDEWASVRHGVWVEWLREPSSLSASCRVWCSSGLHWPIEISVPVTKGLQ